VIHGDITIGSFVAFGVYLATLIWPMIALGWAISLIQRGEAATDRIDALFRETPEVADPAHAIRIGTEPPHSVEFDHVWFKYPGHDDAPWALRDLSFVVPAGATLGIVGATGSGKSSIVELAARTYDPTRGTVRIGGIDLRELRVDDLHSLVSIVPQETFLFSETVRENVLLGTADDGHLAAAASSAQLDAAIPDLPHGWETLLGERGINLSGGQRQRTAIARSLVRDPSVLVLDDALSAVDAETERRILDRLEGAEYRQTRIIVSHRFSAVRHADEIIVLDGGAIVERGTHDSLVAAGGRYTELLMRQEIEESLERD
jgi:ATP-binding cassette subfamily B protein